MRPSFRYRERIPFAAAQVFRNTSKNNFKRDIDILDKCTICTSTVSFNIAISTGSKVPIYKQITDQVWLAVATGKLAVGDQLPSVRALAEELVVNPNTIARAYADLTRDGLIESKAGRGVFITHKRKVFTQEEGWRRLEPFIDAAIGEGMALDFTHEQLKEIFEKKLNQWKPAKGTDHE
jgi:GntR family transcriptional regulator